ncbi:MAG: Gfo/Idh/MocA family oxidoreductase [Erysipelotrichaceae bacterium]|nr:Gfo/Idh/MocA family oxidoreductase [Erysipelotrichaceae bacterium]
MYKFGIISTASICKRVMDAIRLTGNEIVAIASRDIEKARDFARSNNIEKYYGSYEELYLDTDIDIVYIPVINDLHFKCAKEALSHHKHVLLEKPFTLNSEDSKELFEIAKKNNCLLMEGVKNVFTPSFRFIKENLNLLGDIESIYLCLSSSEPFKEEHWMHDYTKGGGVYGASSPYVYHFLFNLFSDRISNLNGTAVFADMGGDKECDFTFEVDGIKVHSFISSISKIDNKSIIKGKNAVMEIDTFWRSHHVTIYKDNNLLKEFNDEGNEFIYEIEHFIECLNNKQIVSDVVTADNSIKESELIEELYTKWNKVNR